tara:strand:+ start:562 stop:1446 length:885 start_codon:yes stop_codon:yes gene_type:complete
MATNIIMHCREIHSSEVINESFVRLLKYRIKMIQEANQVNFFSFGGDGQGLLPEITHIPYAEGNQRLQIPSDAHDEWNILELFDHPLLQEKYSKNVIWNPRLMPLDLCQTAILGNMPMPGDVHELPQGHGMDLETMKMVQDNSLPFLELPMKWWTDDNPCEYRAEWYIGYAGNTLKDIKQKFTRESIDEYKDKGGVWKFIEDSFKGVVLPTKLAQFSPYYLNDQEKNDELNAQYEEIIRPYFPQEWYPPMDEDMDAPLFSYNHEWRDVSKQVRFIYLDGRDDIKSDMYARLWFI